MKVVFESVFKEDYGDIQIIDFIDFKSEGIDSLVDDLNENTNKLVTLKGNKLIFKHYNTEYSLIDDNFIGKEVIDVDIDFNESYDTLSFSENDINSDMVYFQEELSQEEQKNFTTSATQQIQPLYDCIEEKK